MFPVHYYFTYLPQETLGNLGVLLCYYNAMRNVGDNIHDYRQNESPDDDEPSFEKLIEILTNDDDPLRRSTAGRIRSKSNTSGHA